MISKSLPNDRKTSRSRKQGMINERACGHQAPIALMASVSSPIHCVNLKDEKAPRAPDQPFVRAVILLASGRQISEGRTVAIKQGCTMLSDRRQFVRLRDANFPNSRRLFTICNEELLIRSFGPRLVRDVSKGRWSYRA